MKSKALIKLLFVGYMLLCYLSESTSQNQIGVGLGINLGLPKFKNVQNDYSITSYSPRVGTEMTVERITGISNLFDFRLAGCFQMHHYIESIHWFAREDLDFLPTYMEVNSKYNSFGVSIGTGLRMIKNEKLTLRLIACPFLQRGKYTSQIDQYKYGSNNELIGPYPQGGAKRGEWYWGGNVGVEISLNLSGKGNLVLQNLYGYGETVGLITTYNEQIYFHTPLITSSLVVGYRCLIGNGIR